MKTTSYIEKEFDNVINELEDYNYKKNAVMQDVIQFTYLPETLSDDVFDKCYNDGCKDYVQEILKSDSKLKSGRKELDLLYDALCDYNGKNPTDDLGSDKKAKYVIKTLEELLSKNELGNFLG